MPMRSEAYLTGAANLFFSYNRLQIFEYQEQVEWVGGAGFEFPLSIPLAGYIISFLRRGLDCTGRSKTCWNISHWALSSPK